MRFLYPSLFRYLAYPLVLYAKGRPTFSVLREREKSQYFSFVEIEALQFKKLKLVLENANTHVPFYRETFKSIGFVPEDMTSLDEFKMLDFFTDKEIVRDNTESFISEICDRSKLSWHRTGGSTGEPLHFATDKNTGAASSAGLIRAIHRYGVEIGDPHCMFWGSPTFITRSSNMSLGVKLRKAGLQIKEKLMNRRVFLNYNIGDDNFRQIHAQIERFQPTYIRGMPTSLFVFSRLAVENGLVFKKARPKFVHSACEQLFPWQKEMIEKAFACPVSNTYGLSEFGDIAFEAPCGGLHTLDEDVLIELREFTENESEIVSTQLNNLSTPLIKYRTSDIVTEHGFCENMTCNLGNKVLKGIKGRAHDFIMAPDGRYLHGQFFTHILVFYDSIKKYQIHQRAKNLLEIKLVVDNTFGRIQEVEITSAIRGYMGQEVQIGFDYCDQIPLTARGKHRWIISDLITIDAPN
jgi:phenylacetate-CoA ligase